jgi:hypothetical protein
MRPITSTSTSKLFLNAPNVSQMRHDGLMTMPWTIDCQHLPHICCKFVDTDAVRISVHYSTNAENFVLLHNLALLSGCVTL